MKAALHVLRVSEHQTTKREGEEEDIALMYLTRKEEKDSVHIPQLNHPFLISESYSPTHRVESEQSKLQLLNTFATNAN